jgi:hypothetical protein
MNDFGATGRKLVQYIQRSQKTLSKRDKMMLQIGMRACHIEEAVSTGDTDRAAMHFQKLSEEVKTL